MGNETKGEIHAALVKVMASVGVVAKSRKNAAQGYQFRGIDDVLSACQGPMAEHGVLCIPRVVKEERETVATKSGGTMVSVRLTVDHYFTARDGSWVICTTVGEAMDSGDKATNKAMSAAMKYCLTMALCIPTHEDDRDTENASPELAAPKAAAPRPAAKGSANKSTAVAQPIGPSGRVPTFAPDFTTGPDHVGIEVEAVIAAAPRCATLAEYEALKPRAKAMEGVASPAEYARVSAAMAKRKGELTKGAA